MACRRRKIATSVALAACLVGASAWAQVDKPRFVILLDNSTSMTENLGSVETHGDGSESQPGCNIDGKTTASWAYDDSKLYLAKTAVLDTIAAFGAAEFALATYSRISLGQSCSTDAECSAIVPGAVCADLPNDGSTQKYCSFHAGSGYLECTSGTGCVSCSRTPDTDDLVLEWRAFDCAPGRCSFSEGCMGGQVIVGFPPAGSSNLYDIYRLIDGKEDFPPWSATSNRELRAVTMTPLASALDSVGAWLTDPSRTAIGPSAGLLSNNPAARDPRLACRSYSVILITDGEDTCSPNGSLDPIASAAAMYKAGINLYVVGFGTGFSASLNSMAMEGSGQARSAYFAANRPALIASLGDILMNAMAKPRCNCDATCYDEAAAFPLKGQPCSVGVGRCKRQGVYACNAAGDGVMCATAAACGAAPLVAGTPVAEQCGSLAGCLAPSAADCADENCDGSIDEGLSCACASKAETCNGLDDNCDGVVDNVASIACGVNLGACKAGVTACVSDGAGTLKLVCQGEVAASPEICDGIDNDCDGLADQFARGCYPPTAEGCRYDAAAKTWSCTGGCKPGLETCLAGKWGACAGAVIPATEVACDGIDNNCDGRTDENNPSASDTCYPAGAVGCDAATGACTGQCALGRWACAANKMGLVCSGSRVPTAELCNGKDDDCDGKIDEDFPTLGQPCNEQSCQGAGQLVCNSAGTDVECTVLATGPTPEVCDGRDNDCDGTIDEVPAAGEPPMPGVGVACGSDVGECQAGLSVCAGGKISCSFVGPAPELCDGKDNDCNGSVDDAVAAPSDICNPDGMAPGQPMAGDCRPGIFACRGADGWKCQGGRGPAQEVCDGRDNDCDGRVDNDALCAAGLACLDGECVPRCATGGEQYPCPSDRYCKDGVCLVKACARKPCAPGFVCQPDGTCVDPCSLVNCLEGAVCKGGVCVDCYSTGCAAGQKCIARRCQGDPCATTTCPSGQFCQDGRCLPSCQGITCGEGFACRQGECIKLSCARSCDATSYCDVTTGTCEPKHCVGVPCPAGRVCVNSTGRCTDDPCELVRCPNGQSCALADDGTPDCVAPVSSGVATQAASSGSGLFSCNVGRGDGPGGLLALALAGLASLLVRRTRRP